MTRLEHVLGNEAAITRLWVAWARSTVDPEGVGHLESLHTALERAAALEEYRGKLLETLARKWTPKARADLASADLVTVDTAGPLADIRRAAEANRATVLAWVRHHEERPATIDADAWGWATQLAPQLYRQSSMSRWLVS